MGEPGRCDAGNTVGGIEGLVGRRVVVRHRVGDKLTDAVGELSADGADLVVHTRRGPVRVARTAVTAVRAIPPPPPRRASLAAITRLEELCADAWPALVDERLGAWRLRAADGFTARANGALAVGNPGMPMAAALDVVRAFAERHGIAPRVQVPVGSPWDRAVAAEGWVLDVGHAAGALVSVQVAELAGLPDGPRLDAGEPEDAWWQLVLGGPPTPAQRHVLAAPCDNGSPGAGTPGKGSSGAGTPGKGSCAENVAPATLSAHGHLVLRDGRAVVGAGRAVVVEDHVHLSVLTVAPAARRQGHGTALLAGAARWGRDHGARWGVLQVAVHNTAALALYARSGWTEHHRYRYLVPPTPNA